MPQIDLKYSHDLDLDTHKLFSEIETLINKLDDSAGACKSRAYPASDYLHQHVTICIAVLKKPHRDEAFMENCLTQLDQVVKPLLPNDCHYAIELAFSGRYYLTSRASR